MASLRSTVNAHVKEPSAVVRFDGNRARNILDISINNTIEDSISTATISLAENPGINPENKVQIEQGYNGKHLLTFTGYVDTIDYDEFEETYTVSCRDVLKKAVDTYFIQEVKFGINVEEGIYYYSTYSNIDGGTFRVHEYSSLGALHAAHPETTDNITNEGVYAHAVVQWLLVMCGFAEGSEIQVDNTEFYVGDITPLKFFLSNAYDSIMQLAQLIGWRLFADAAGVVRFKRKPRNYSGYTQWAYSTKTEHNTFKVKKTVTNTDLRNYVEVRGASGIVATRRGASEYIGSTPYRGVLISNELIDTQGIANYMASRVYNDLNRLKVTLNVEADGNPFVICGDSIAIGSRVINGNYLVEEHNTSMSSEGYFSEITAVQFTGDVPEEEEPIISIVADFVPLQLSVVGDPKWVVQFDASSSYSNRGQIVTYKWDWPNGTSVTESDPQVWYVFNEEDISGGNSQTVTLTVTDELGNTAFVASGITTDYLQNGQVIKYRHLYGALTTQAVGSSNGGLTWQTANINAISVAASNFAAGGVYVSSGYALFGTSDSKIYRTINNCASVTLVYSATAAVNWVSIPELNSNYAIAGTEDGKVLISTNGGVAWSVKKDFAFAIREVRFAYTDYQYILVVGEGVGNTYESFDQGNSWNKIGGGVGALDVLHETSGAFTNYYTHSGGVLSVLSGVNTPMSGSAGSIVAATVVVDRDDGVMAVNDSGQHYNAASGVFYATQNNSANTTAFMIRDGDLLPLVFYATQSGISKSINQNLTIDELYYPAGTMPVGGWGKMVAYGPLSSPVVSGTFIGYTAGHLADANGTGVGSNGIFMYSEASGVWSKIRGDGPFTANNFWMDVVDNLAVATQSDGGVGYTKIPASGIAVWEDDQISGSDKQVYWVAVGRKPTSKSTVFMGYNYDADPYNDSPKLIKITDFINNPTPGTELARTGIWATRASPPSASDRGSMVVRTGSLIAPSESLIEIDWNSDPPTQETMIGGQVKDGNQTVLNFTSKYWSLIANDSGMTHRSEGVHPNAYLSYIGPSIAVAAGQKKIAASFIDKGMFYYGDATGIGKVTAYGQGVSRITLPYPSGYYLTSLTVNTDVRNTTDYICASLTDPFSLTGNDIVLYYSIDQAETWVQGPRITVDSGDFVAWFVKGHT